MAFLIDTNIISEVRKRDRGDPSVAAWWDSVAEDDLWLSPLVLGEIRKGAEQARRRDPRKAEALEGWLADVMSGFSNRVLPVDATFAPHIDPSVVADDPQCMRLEFDHFAGPSVYFKRGYPPRSDAELALHLLVHAHRCSPGRPSSRPATSRRSSRRVRSDAPPNS